MRRRGPCLTPFAPQRILTATRAHRGFYKRPRAPPRRSSASVREGPGLATREAGLAARLQYGKDRARPEGAEAAGRGGGGWGKRPEGGGGRGHRERARARGAGRGAKKPPHPPAAAWDPSNSAPPSPPCRESVPHPSALGALRRLRRRAGRGPSLQSSWGCCCPGRKDALSLSGDLTGMLAPTLHFLRRRLVAGRPKSACSGGGWGQKNEMIWGSVFEEVVGKKNPD